MNSNKWKWRQMTSGELETTTQTRRQMNRYGGDKSIGEGRPATTSLNGETTATTSQTGETHELLDGTTMKRRLWENWVLARQGDKASGHHQPETNELRGGEPEPDWETHALLDEKGKRPDTT